MSRKLREIPFEPKSDINDYLSTSYDVAIYNKLLRKYEGTVEPLEFLNLLHEQFEIICANVDRPIELADRLINMNIDEKTIPFLIKELSKMPFNAWIMESVEILHSTPDWRKLEDCMSVVTTRVELFIQNKTKPTENIGKAAPERSRSNKLIRDIFLSTYHPKDWAYAFKSESDFNDYVELLSRYFEFSNYSIPAKPIQLKINTKTKTAKALKGVYKDLGQMNLSRDRKFFEMVRALSYFSDLSDDALYVSIRGSTPSGVLKI